MRRGMTILGHATGTHDPRYAAAEIRYAKLLGKTGQHSLASKLEAEGEATMRDVHQTQCVGCTINITAIR